MQSNSTSRSFNFGCLAATVGIIGVLVSIFFFILSVFTEEIHFTTFAWSPDGTRLAFGASEGEYRTELWVVDANGKNLKMLTGSFEGQHYPGLFTSLQWSATGDAIFFETSKHIYRYSLNSEQPDLVNENPLRENPAERAISGDGLVAQSVCTNDYYSTPENVAIEDECFHELKVTNSGNSGTLFTVDSWAYVWARSRDWILAATIMGLTSVLVIVGGVRGIVESLKAGHRQ